MIMLTKQEIFNKVYTHLVKQGGRSTNFKDELGREVCAYRGADGSMCAVGCLIPEKFYSKSLEGSTVNSFTVTRVLQRAGVMDEFCRQSTFLYDLQVAHDTCYLNNKEDFVTEIKSRLSRIADTYKLIIPKIG
jgi:hypothetical protein